MKNKKISKRIIRNNLVAYSFVIVSLVTLLVLVYIPMISTVDYSFRRIGMVGVGEDAWIGLENYRMLFSQSTFWKAIGNTILMAVMGLLTIPVGFLLAVLVNSLGRSRLQEFFRVGFYLPNIITSTLKGIVDESDNRMSRMLFKLAVEIAILQNLVAATQEIDPLSLERLRGECVKEVKRINGAFSFDDAVDWQKG